MNTDGDWAQGFGVLWTAVREGRGAFEALVTRLYALAATADVVGQTLSSELQDSLDEVSRALANTERECSELHARMVVRPSARLVRGWPPSHEEYHLLAARGVQFFSHKILGLSEYDEVELARMFFYDDDERRCMINPQGDLSCPDPAPIRVGKRPEELTLDQLRPEQREFFETELPTLASRFQSDPAEDTDQVASEVSPGDSGMKDANPFAYSLTVSRGDFQDALVYLNTTLPPIRTRVGLYLNEDRLVLSLSSGSCAASMGASGTWPETITVPWHRLLRLLDYGSGATERLELRVTSELHVGGSSISCSIETAFY